MRSAEEFWDKAAGKFAKSPVKDVRAYNETMARTKAHLSAGDSVLEVGCGTGSTALLLADGVKEVTASDISANMIGIARKKAEEGAVENVTFAHAALFDEALAPGSFDVVLAFNLLHLLEDIPGAIRRINALLKPEGRFISKTVCLAEQTRLWGVLISIMGTLGLAPYVKSLRISELEDMITGGGFRILETGLYPASPPSRFIVARKL